MSIAEKRIEVINGSDAILNALPNPILLIAPDGKIVDANIAAESFFETSIQHLQRQILRELVPFGTVSLTTYFHADAADLETSREAFEVTLLLVGEVEGDGVDFHRGMKLLRPLSWPSTGNGM